LDLGFRLLVDGTGNLVMMGHYNGTINVGGGDLTVIGIGGSTFLAKYDASGAHLWSRGFPSSFTCSGAALAMDEDGDLAMGGYFDGTVDFGGGPFGSAGRPDIFVAKYGADGAHLWSKHFGSSGDDIAYGLATDGSGNVIFTGEFHDTIDFGGGPLVATGSSMFLVKYTTAGDHIWSQSFGLAIGRAIAVDNSDNAFVGFIGDAVVGGGPVVGTGPRKLLAKFDSQGTHQWTRAYDGPGWAVVRSASATSSGGVAVIGEFEDTVDLGAGPMASSGGGDIFVAVYDANGEHLCSRSLGSVNQDYAWDVAVDPSDNVLASGRFEISIDAGGGTLVSAGYGDALVAKYRLPVATATTPALETSVGQNYPNPFNPSTSIDVTIGERTAVVVEIYDARGARVAILDAGVKDAGTHRVAWGGTDATGKRVGSGVYFYRLEGAGALTSRKMVLLK
jgi:hypothetical protein